MRCESHTNENQCAGPICLVQVWGGKSYFGDFHYCQKAIEEGQRDAETTGVSVKVIQNELQSNIPSLTSKTSYTRQNQQAKTQQRVTPRAVTSSPQRILASETKMTPSNQALSISNEEFKLMRDLIYNRFGINLSEQKRGLLVTRLSKYVRQAQMTSFKEYYEHLLADRSGKELVTLAEMISTNHTYFFRESEHFDFMRKTALPDVLNQIRSNGPLDLRVWCAAASSGEEPYGLIINLMEHLGVEYSSWQAGLLATDISQRALATATAGVYDAERVHRIPVALRNRYFTKHGNDQWQVKAEVRNEVVFRRFNLMNQQFPFKQPFHLIFCRNVMIYFDQQTVQALVRRMYEHTAPGGYLFIGKSESLGRIQNPYAYVEPAIYRKI